MVWGSFRVGLRDHDNTRVIMQTFQLATTSPTHRRLSDSALGILRELPPGTTTTRPVDPADFELLPVPKPDLPAWRVKAWLGKVHEIGDAEVEAIITANAPDTGTRLEWLARWRSAPMIPFANDLVQVIAQGLQLDPAQVWLDIAAFG